MISKVLAGLHPGLDMVFSSFTPSLAMVIMMSHHLVEFLQSTRVELFYCLADFFMNLRSSLEKQAVVGNLLSQGVFKDVLKFRE